MTKQEQFPQKPKNSRSEKVSVKIPLIRKTITVPRPVYKLFRVIAPLLVLGIVILVVTVIVLLTPVTGDINQQLVITILHFGLGLATPALIALQGEVVNQNAGTKNMGLEGIMGVSAFFCFFIAFITGNLLLAMLVAGLVGLMVSALHDFNSNGIKVNSSISGLGINLAATSLGGFLYLTLFGAGTVAPQIPTIPKIAIPFLSDIPIWGYVLFEQNLITYIALFIAFMGEIVLNHSHWGLTIKACGQNPEAAATAGISVRRVRTICCLYGGFVAGLGGAFLTLNTGFFAEYLINGRGWIAYALARLSIPSPIFGILASLIFGVGQAVQFRIQGLQLNWIPYEFIWIIPYSQGNRYNSLM